MPAIELALYIEPNATFYQGFIWTNKQSIPYDLTGYTAAMQIRNSYYFTPNSQILMDFSSVPQQSWNQIQQAWQTIETPYAQGTITLGGVDGTITLEAPRDQTQSIQWSQGFYDLLLINSANFATRLLRGPVIAIPQVTD